MAWFFVSVIFLLALLGGLYWRWRQKIAAEVKEGAEIEWAHLSKNDPDLLKGVSEEQFHEIYARVHTPRFPGYALAIAGAMVASLPLSLALLLAPIWAADKLGMLPEPIEIVRYVQLGEAKSIEPWQCGPECQLQVVEAYGGFYYFFGLLIIWLVIVAFFMRRYHSRRPGYLRDEIIRARDGES